jgi:diaminopimelate epimerase
MNIHTTLLSGAGNTFHVCYLDSGIESIQQKISISDMVSSICRRNPADGFIFLKIGSDKKQSSSESENEYTWHFYNKDGSDAEMCGNAARCVGLFVSEILNNNKPTFLLNTAAGPILIRQIKHSTSAQLMFEVQMTPLKRMQHKDYFYCDTGVPHVVIPISNINRYPLMKSFCIEIREHRDFQPRGTNVTLIDTTNPSKISAVTFERGVEDFTQACGTGAVAAGYYLWEKMGFHLSKIHMPGGILEINLENTSQPKMVGPAVKLGEFDYEF